MAAILGCASCAAATPSRAESLPPAGAAATGTVLPSQHSAPALPHPAPPLPAAAPAAPAAGAAAAGTAPAGASAADALQLEQVSIEAPEPKYVAPTLRDRIGRIWAPVLIDGKGPFRLVLDTGASNCAITAAVAQALGIVPAGALVRLHGVTGTAVVPSIRADSLIVGDMQLTSTVLPIVPDALGGAQGVLGTEGLLDKRIYIDFRHDRITIRRSHARRAEDGFVTVPLKVSPQHLLTATAYVGSVRAMAIIDTGAQVSVANLALREALLRKRPHYQFTKDQIIGATDDVADGQGTAVPPIHLGGIRIQGAHITTGGMQIFDTWKLTAEPVILIGMDALGTVDVLIIDYRRHELQIRTRDMD